MKKMLSLVFVSLFFLSTAAFAGNNEINMNKARIVNLNSLGLALLSFPEKVTNVNLLPLSNNNLKFKLANNYSVILYKKNKNIDVDGSTIFVSLQRVRKPLVFIVE